MQANHDEERVNNDVESLKEISRKLKNMVTVNYFEQVIREKTDNNEFIHTKQLVGKLRESQEITNQYLIEAIRLH